VIKALDSLGKGAIEQVAESLQGWLGWHPKTALVNAPSPNRPTQLNVAANAASAVNVSHDQNSLEHLKRIFSILQDTPGFDPMRLLPVLMQLLVRPETQQMGRQIASGLVQRNVARLIREFLIRPDLSPERLGYSLTNSIAGSQSSRGLG
jgi:hypothetical protein